MLDTDTGAVVRTLHDDNNHDVYDLALNPEATVLAACVHDTNRRAVRMFDVKTGDPIFDLSGG